MFKCHIAYSLLWLGMTKCVVFKITSQDAGIFHILLVPGRRTQKKIGAC